MTNEVPSLDERRAIADAALEQRVNMALGMLASAQAAITAAVALLAGMQTQPAPDPEPEQDPALDLANCPHPPDEVSTIAAMGDEERQVWCLRCGTRLR